MWLENPLVGARGALTLGLGASLRAGRFAADAPPLRAFGCAGRLPPAPAFFVVAFFAAVFVAAVFFAAAFLAPVLPAAAGVAATAFLVGLAAADAAGPAPSAVPYGPAGAEPFPARALFADAPPPRRAPAARAGAGRGDAAPGPPSTASRRRRIARSSSTILRWAESTSVRVGMPRVAHTCSTWACRPARTRICASTSAP